MELHQKEQVESKIDHLNVEMDNLMNRFDAVRDVSHNPQIIRQLIHELRIDEINQRYNNANLSDSNPKFRDDDGKFDYHKFLEKDYRLYNELILSTITDSDHYLKTLFKYNIKIELSFVSFNKY